MIGPSTPNPVWAREMRQAARLTRTPVILAAVTAVLGLMVCAVGGMASVTTPPAEVGSVLFQTFFSLAFAVVALMAPGVAALTIASERAGRTWEAVVMTGIAPRDVALGKFLASLTYIGLYLVALAPVGVLPFLFGGVTPMEVIAAFLLLGVFATLAIGFGLAVSSAAKTPTVALLVTMPLAVVGSMITYLGLGVGLSVAAHERWPNLGDGIPVWLPTAYARVDVGLEYLGYLVLLPAGVTVILAGLFRAVTVANLSDANDDRSSGLKRWFLLAQTLIVGMGLFVSSIAKPSSRCEFTVAALAVSSALSLLTLFLLAADPSAPSRRVAATWARERASAARRFFGPGLARSAFTLVATNTIAQVALAGSSISSDRGFAGWDSAHRTWTAMFAAYGVGFFGFLTGSAVFARATFPRLSSPRAVLALAVFVAAAGPLFVTAILGLTEPTTSSSFVTAAPSPFYIFAILNELDGASTAHTALRAGEVAVVTWGVVGLALGILGARRLGVLSAAERSDHAALDDRIRSEDQPAGLGREAS